MANVSKLLSLLRSVCKIVVLFICCLTTLLAILSAVVNCTLLNEETYASLTEREGFLQDMTALVRDELEAECLFYGLPFTVLDDALSSEAIEAFSQKYVQNLYVALRDGKPLEEPAWQSAPFVSAVQRFFDSLPDSEKPLDITAADTIGGELSVCALSMLKAGINDKMLALGHRVFSHPLLLRLSTGFTWFVLIAVLAALFGLILAWRRARYHLYTTAFAIGVTSAVAFFSFWLFRRYDPAVRLALLDSPLKVYVDALLNSVLEQSVYITGCCFAVATGFFLISVIVQFVPYRRSKVCDSQD